MLLARGLNCLGLTNEGPWRSAPIGASSARKILLSTLAGRKLPLHRLRTRVATAPATPCPAPERDRAADWEACLANLAEFPGRVTLYIGRSVNAARLFPHDDPKLDFVYVDGDHGYDAVFRDLAMWWPRPARGRDPDGARLRHPRTGAPTPGSQGVKPAVHKFAEQYRQAIHLIVEATAGFPTSYYFVKPSAYQKQQEGQSMSKRNWSPGQGQRRRERHGRLMGFGALFDVSLGISKATGGC